MRQNRYANCERKTHDDHNVAYDAAIGLVCHLMSVSKIHLQNLMFDVSRLMNRKTRTVERITRFRFISKSSKLSFRFDRTFVDHDIVRGYSK